MEADNTTQKTTQGEQSGKPGEAAAQAENESEQQLKIYLKKLGFDKPDQQDAFKRVVEILVSKPISENEKQIEKIALQKLNEVDQRIKEIISKERANIVQQNSENLKPGSSSKIEERKDEFAKRFFTRISSLPMAKRR